MLRRHKLLLNYVDPRMNHPFKTSIRFFIRLNFTNYLKKKKPFVKLSILLIIHLTLNN